MAAFTHPADELAAIRIQIQALKAREKQLCNGFLGARGPVLGATHEVSVKRMMRRVLKRDALPGDILNNPKFWESRVSYEVVARPRLDAAPHVSQTVRAVRPGDPVALEAQARAHQTGWDEDDFDVIERVEPLVRRKVA